MSRYRRTDILNNVHHKLTLNRDMGFKNRHIKKTPSYICLVTVSLHLHKIEVNLTY